MTFFYHIHINFLIESCNKHFCAFNSFHKLNFPRIDSQKSNYLVKSVTNFVALGTFA